MLAVEIFQDLTWRVGSLEAETALPKGPKFVIFARGPPLGSPSSLSTPISTPSKSPEFQAYSLQYHSLAQPRPETSPPNLSPALFQARPSL